jgi:VIT1/CCC1 family predicted Fe2+/Mn2+ transporter
VPSQHRAEVHRSDRIGWLRALVLGANDGILSTGALLLGVAGAGATRGQLVVAGVAAVSAGAFSMGIGEYVSVSSQRDTEDADRATEAAELEDDPESELAELKNIYVDRGLDEGLALQVAEALTATDPLAAHLRDELGITDEMRARPLQAASSSFASFAVGASIPLLTAVLAPSAGRAIAITVATVVAMVTLGAVGGRLGGASLWRGALRVGIGGSAALALTYLIGVVFGTAVS